MKVVKIILISLAALILLAVLGAVILVNVVNPNDYKPEIVQQVQDNSGLTLKLNGDISWTFFPHIGIQVNQATIYATRSSKTPIFDINKAIISVELIPLLSQNIKVNLVELDKPVIHWTLGQELPTPPAKKAAPANLANTTQATTSDNSTQRASQEVTRSNDQNFDFNVRNIGINDGKITVNDPNSKITYQLDNVQFKGQNITLNEAFPIRFSANLKSQPEQINTQIKWQGNITLSDNQFQVKGAQLSLEGKAKIKNQSLPFNLKLDTNITGQFDQNAKQVTIKNINLNLNKQLTLKGDFAINMKDEPLTYKGHLATSKFNLLALMKSLNLPPLKPSDPSALRQVDAQLTLKGSPTHIHIPNLNIHLGQSALKGSMVANLGSLNTIKAQARVNTLDLSQLSDLHGARLPIRDIRLKTNLSLKPNGYPNTLNGSIDMDIASAKIIGIDIGQMVIDIRNFTKEFIDKGDLNSALSALSGDLPRFLNQNQFHLDPNSGQETNLGKMTMNAKIKNGVVYQDHLLIQSNHFQIMGNGTINLNNKNQANYNLTTVGITRMQNGSIQRDPVSIPLHITGNNTNGIHVNINQNALQGILENVLKQKLQKRLTDQIKDKGMDLLKGLF